MSVGGGGEWDRDARAARPDLPLAADLVEAASDLSVSMLESDPLGLSVFPLPGIFERMTPRKDFEDSLVSDLLKEGYD